MNSNNKYKLNNNRKITPIYMQTLLLCWLIFFFNISAFAQNDINLSGQATAPCGSTEEFEQAKLDDPNFELEMQKNIEKMLVDFDDVLTSKKRNRNSAPNITIPIVFHILHDDCNDLDAMFPNSIFNNAIAELNAKFPTNIQFKLSEKDPNGNPSTGINRIYSGLTLLGVGNKPVLKEKIYWPRTKYMNVYIINKNLESSSSGLAWQPYKAHSDETKDGVITSTFSWSDDYWFPTFIHEVGHWLGLHHLWGDGYINDSYACYNDDFDVISKLQPGGSHHYLVEEHLIDNPITDWNIFNDTPNCTGSNGVCISKDSCTDPNSDLIDNLMDYSSCANNFTNGQIKFMEFILASNIADRGMIQGNSSEAFYENANDDRIVFKDYIFYEADANNGNVDLQTVEIEIIGGTEFPTTFTLNNDYSISGVPSGLTYNLVRDSDNPKKAYLSLYGNLGNHDEDLEDLTISFNIFPINDPVLDYNKQTKKLKIDCVESVPIQHKVVNGTIQAVSTDVLKYQLSFPNFESKVFPEFAYHDGYTYSLSSLTEANSYIFYSNNYGYFLKEGVEFSVLTKPDILEIDLVDYGEIVDIEENNLTSFVSAAPSYIPIEVANNLDFQDKFILFSFGSSCAKYYGWVKLRFEPNKMTVLSYAVNPLLNQPINAGEYIEVQAPDCNQYPSTSHHFNIDRVTVYNDSEINPFFDNNQNGSQPANETYTVSANNPPITIDLNTATDFRFVVKPKTTVSHLGNYYVFIDYNKDGYFDTSELVFSQNAANYYDGIVSLFETGTSDTFTLRIVASYHPLSDISGCEYFVDGEIEDYLIEVKSDCPDLYLSGYLDEVINPITKTNLTEIGDAYLTSNENRAIAAERYVLLQPSTSQNYILLDYGSTFCGYIEACEPASLRKAELQLQQTNLKVFPNPFSEQCTIEYRLNSDSKVRLIVADITGKIVATIKNGEQQNEGSHRATFNAKDLSQGIYYCTLIAGEKVATQKLVIAK